MGMKLSSLTSADKLIATDGSGLNCALAATTAFFLTSPFSNGPLYSRFKLAVGLPDDDDDNDGVHVCVGSAVCSGC